MAGSGVDRSWAAFSTSTRQQLETAGQAPRPRSGTRQVRLVHAWSWVGATEHGDFVAQYEELNVLAEYVRHDSRTNPSACKKIKYGKRKDTPGSCPTGDHRWSATQARLLAPHRKTSPVIAGGGRWPRSWGQRGACFLAKLSGVASERLHTSMRRWSRTRPMAIACSTAGVPAPVRASISTSSVASTSAATTVNAAVAQRVGAGHPRRTSALLPRRSPRRSIPGWVGRDRCCTAGRTGVSRR